MSYALIFLRRSEALSTLIMPAAARGAHGATEDDEASTSASTDQDEDDDHVKLLNRVKVHTAV